MARRSSTATDARRSGTPAHPIQVVARRTGLSADVIRAWEKRYAVVSPVRSAVGRRLYSDKVSLGAAPTDRIIPRELRRLRTLLPADVAIVVEGTAAEAHGGVLLEIGASVLCDVPTLLARLRALREATRSIDASDCGVERHLRGRASPPPLIERARPTHRRASGGRGDRPRSSVSHRLHLMPKGRHP